MLNSTLMVILVALSSLNIGVTPGLHVDVPPGYVVSNLDPNFDSAFNNEIYNPNFLPGFQAGLTNTSVSWSSGIGYGRVHYSIGPWSHLEVGLPHFAVGPQCCNFMEVPHTQQFRLVDWGDYYNVKAGLGPPGVNVENYTTDFTSPVDVGLRTDWNWTVQVSLDWKTPLLMDPANEWAAIRIAVTQFVPNAPSNLVSTLLNFWMEANSSSLIAPSADGTSRGIFQPNVVAYHPLQVTGTGNENITMNISPYLEDTLRVLGLENIQNQPPVISYVYLNVEGYNFAWNATLLSFKIFSKPTSSSQAFQLPQAIVGAVVAVVAGSLVFLDARKSVSARLRRPRSLGSG